MKNLRQKVVGILLLAVSFVFAQTTSSPWVISVGMHGVNNHIDANGTNGQATNYSNYKFMPPPTRLSVARNLNKFLVADVQLSLGSIPNEVVNLQEIFFMSFIPGIQYKLTSLWDNENHFFDPYLRFGSGLLFHDYSILPAHFGIPQSKSHFVVSLGIGSNFWFTPKFGANIQLEYVPTPADNSATPDYFQVSASVAFRFGKTDSDGDGVPDNLDRCPKVPGPVETNGCPDLDGDGVPDIDDMCPTVFGPPENAGCPWPDTDGDGVPNHIDKCPNVFGPPENAGCPWPDADGDGVPDHLDKCPNIPGIKEYEGCPQPQQRRQPQRQQQTPIEQNYGHLYSDTQAYDGYDTTNDDKLTDLFSGILFDTDSWVIKSKSLPYLDAIAIMLKDSRNENFLITGHTDTVGDEVYNIMLAKKRIETVVRILAGKGVNVERLRYKIVGSKEAIYTPNAPHKLRLADRKVVVRRITNINEWNSYDRIKYELKFLEQSNSSNRYRR